VSEGTDALVSEGGATREVKVAEIARGDDGEFGQRIDFWVAALDEALEGFVVEVDAVGEDETFEGVAVEEFEEEWLVVETFDFASSEVFESWA